MSVSPQSCHLCLDSFSIMFSSVLGFPSRELSAHPNPSSPFKLVSSFAQFSAALLRQRDLRLLLCHLITREKVWLNGSSCGPGVPDVAQGLFLEGTGITKKPQRWIKSHCGGGGGSNCPGWFTRRGTKKSLVRFSDLLVRAAKVCEMLLVLDCS